MFGEIAGIMNLVSLPFQMGANNEARAEALYNQKMEQWENVTKASNAMYDEQQNIASLEQQRILSDVTIQSNQRQAEAQAKVMAATEGVEGGAVKQVIQMTKVNAAQQVGALEQETEEAISQSLVNIYDYADARETASQPPFKSNATEDLFGALFSVSPLMFGAASLFGGDDG